MRIDQRMPALLNVQITLVGKARTTALIRTGQRCLRKNKIQMRKNLQIQLQILGVLGALIGQLRQNRLDLFLFLDLQFP